MCWPGTLQSNFNMTARIRMAIAMAIALGCVENSLTAADPIVLHFDELKVDNIIGNRLGIFPADKYHTKGVSLTTVTCSGRAVVGNIIQVRQIYAGFEVVGGADQPAISPPNFVIPFGGGPARCVLMKFSDPVVRVRLTTDCCLNEVRDVVRLYGLKRASARRFSILEVSEGFDDALTEPDNRLEVRSKTPFQYALFQCTTEQEGFDDLEFEPAPPAESPPASEESEESSFEESQPAPAKSK